LLIFAVCICTCITVCSAFVSSSSLNDRAARFHSPLASCAGLRCSRQHGSTNISSSRSRISALSMTDESIDTPEAVNEVSQDPVWTQRTRSIIGGMALVGVAESAFLSYNKLFRGPDAMAAICGVSGGCGDVLTGPYSRFAALYSVCYLHVYLLFYMTCCCKRLKDCCPLWPVHSS
jgi:hypothetical protein